MSGNNNQFEYYYAHNDPNGLMFEKGGKFHPLKEHLEQTANLAKKYASEFGAGELGYIAGLLHDLGKYADQFQRRLQNPKKERGRNHWSAGAAVLLEAYKNSAKIPALAVDGHHTGLTQIKENRGLLKDIAKKFQSEKDSFTEIDINLLVNRFRSDGIICPKLNTKSSKIYPSRDTAGEMLDNRMLFSTLVDADFIDTEAHFNRNNKGKKYRKTGIILNTEESLKYLEDSITQVKKDSKTESRINKIRDNLMQSAIAASKLQSGIFTLTAPTGCGKTLAMLRFAIEHAKVHNLKRIILVMPFLTIIEQTLNIYKNIFRPGELMDENYIIEDHCLTSIFQEKASREDNETYIIKRKLSENWDAPIILTTNVKFLESLMANKSSRCRKLHRISNSVILFDEIQALPANLAVPTLATLSRLADPKGPYKSSIVFATATQPAFDHLHEKVTQLYTAGWKPREIVSDNKEMFKITSHRITTRWEHERPVTIEELADEINNHKTVMCIVNLKRHARRLCEILKVSDNNLYHLSTNMCPLHRRKKLNQIEKRLEKNEPIRLIATQCVEAGVDIDFTVVYRAFAPLESIAQAAGRCNRNAKEAEGNFTVFEIKDDGKSVFPPGYEKGVGVLKTLLKKICGDNPDNTEIINSPEKLRQYYTLLYSQHDIGKGTNSNEKPLWTAIEAADFEEVAKLYKLIDNASANILVPYCVDTFEKLKAQISSGEPRDKGFLRKWVAEARLHSVSIFYNKNNDAFNLLEPVCFDRSKTPTVENADWFYCLDGAVYDDLLGLILDMNWLF